MADPDLRSLQLLQQKDDINFGGVSDLRPLLDRAERRSVLFPPDLLEIKFTLQRARQLRNLLTRLEHTFPHLAEMAANIQPCDHVVEQISRCISDRGDVLDSASPELGRIRSELRVAQERLLSTLDRLVHSGDVKPYLQEALVTQRQGRYVIPCAPSTRATSTASSTTNRPAAPRSLSSRSRSCSRTTPCASWNCRKKRKFAASCWNSASP
jgi:dsDNA-specific endonuclease/ATPase MutS2